MFGKLQMWRRTLFHRILKKQNPTFYIEDKDTH